jgi:SAM-dependent MidA family methyltransferase
MNAALYDPDGGYYKRSDLKRWGKEGDYRTSPERSELFAATFARYFAKLYYELQQPPEWTIVEAGGGDGHFAAGVLRSLQARFPQVFAATCYHLVEVSAAAREEASERVAEFGDHVSFEAPSRIGRGIYFSNELLDAFPVHRLVHDDEGLAELYVGVDADGNFVWFVGPLSTPMLDDFCREYSVELENKQIVEVNLEIDSWMAGVAEQLDAGYLITVDYGAESADLYDVALRPDGTLRGFSRHGFVDDVLAQPGDYDITSTINWTQVQAAGARFGFRTIEFAPQDKFLLGAGLLAELERELTKATTAAGKLSLTTGAREMILPGGMASSFQVLVQQKG